VLPQPFSDKTKIDVPVNKSEKVIVGNLIFQAEVVEQRLTPLLFSHHLRHTSCCAD
jgi:hypothetical protein